MCSGARLSAAAAIGTVECGFPRARNNPVLHGSDIDGRFHPENPRMNTPSTALVYVLTTAINNA
jgi:hypothetical protein